MKIYLAGNEFFNEEREAILSIRFSQRLVSYYWLSLTKFALFYYWRTL